MIEHIIGGLQHLAECHSPKSKHRIQVFKLIEKEISELNTNNLEVTNYSRRYDFVRNGKNEFNSPVLAVRLKLIDSKYQVTLYLGAVYQFHGTEQYKHNYFELVKELSELLKGIYSTLTKLKVAKECEDCKYTYYLDNEVDVTNCIPCDKMPNLPPTPPITEFNDMSYHCLAGAKMFFEIPVKIGCNYVRECK